MRARELGIRLGDLPPGPHDAITDVEGVRVGHSTIVRGEGPLVVGEGPVRTGVTVVCPREGLARDEPVFAGSHRFNGNGEMTGLEWVREAGTLTTPVAITNTHSVGIVRDALVRAEIGARPKSTRFCGYRACGGGLRRRGDGYDLPRVQGRYRHGLAPASPRAGRVDRRRPRTGELRAPLYAARGRRAGRACATEGDRPFAFRGRGRDTAGGDGFHNRGPRHRRPAPAHPVSPDREAREHRPRPDGGRPRQW